MDSIKDDRFPESATIAGYRTVLSRREPGMKRKILACLANGPKTVPEVAESLEIPLHEVMWWMMGYVRYGAVVPTGDVTEDGHGRYALAEGDE